MHVASVTLILVVRSNLLYGDLSRILLFDLVCLSGRGAPASIDVGGSAGR